MIGGTEDRMGISTQHVPDCPLGIVFVFASNCIYNYYRELLPKSREYNAEGLAQRIARSVIRNIETSVSSLRPPADSCQARNKDFFRSNQTLASGSCWPTLCNLACNCVLQFPIWISAPLQFHSLQFTLDLLPPSTCLSSLLSSPEEQRWPDIEVMDIPSEEKTQSKKWPENPDFLEYNDISGSCLGQHCTVTC